MIFGDGGDHISDHTEAVASVIPLVTHSISFHTLTIGEVSVKRERKRC